MIYNLGTHLLMIIKVPENLIMMAMMRLSSRMGTSSQTVAYWLSKSSHLDFEIWKWVASSHFPSFLFVCFLNSGSHSLRHSGFHFSNYSFKGKSVRLPRTHP